MSGLKEKLAETIFEHSMNGRPVVSCTKKENGTSGLFCLFKKSYFATSGTGFIEV
ncbi:MAG: hypothetical protein ABIN01_01415 [Ferruginibacter sp.]